MRRTRKSLGKPVTKVWHNPDIVAPRKALDAPSNRGSEGYSADRDEHHRALRSLFSSAEERSGPREATRAVSKIVSSKGRDTDPMAVDRQRLLSRILLAEGRLNISKAANEFLKAGHAFPNEHDLYLQLLEHTDEMQVRAAIEGIARLLVSEPPKRTTVLESRLRRIEQLAEENETRRDAESLRRKVREYSNAQPLTTRASVLDDAE